MRRSGLVIKVGVAALAVTLVGCVHQHPAVVKHHAKKALSPDQELEETRSRVAALQAQMDALKAQVSTQSPPAETDPIATPLPRPLKSGTTSASPGETGATGTTGQASAPPSGQQINTWYNGLSNGLVEYAVPSTMYVGDDVTVSVRVHGTQSHTATLAGRNGAVMVKVSSQMQAQLGQSANPKEFLITPAGPVQKTVVDAGDNTWTWTVRPLRRMSSAQLDIQLWVLYPGQEASDQVPVVSTTIPVVVAVPPLPVIIREVVPQDPPTIAQQLFPKGIWAAFGASLLWLFHWVKKRFGKQTAEPVHAGSKTEV